MLNNNEGNLLIKERLKENKVFFVGRVGITELQVSYYYDRQLSIPDRLIYLLTNETGVYGNSIKEFCCEYIESLKSSDIQIYWDINNLKELQNYLYAKYSSNSVIVANRSIEPFHYSDPWSYELKNKKVLVIHPFSESINNQYNNRINIWNNAKILPDFELITYKSIQSTGNDGPHYSWVESLEMMKEDISKINFDVALLGCGAYGMPLCSYIKNTLDKTSIYIGGGLQILFGIKGGRWDRHEEISKMYNEHWIRPSKNEQPIKFKNIDGIDGGCYW